eukprot:Plantae.Rhodophyta-Purpureofilum_apyrenoidigerum.ctg1545.p1 GENE.Plantae.Rhodophyta-Purpureofilum_apyrenoidigerum.ctg1545~~Plantae.Rhodophyta-Purpureofilum_apyrenoidigerum.ctg1545.p1  ORF type:complete len:334 (-),score=53.54 Plantae.Rhodophyta-Purpureofilum_apyrenoidigerum.ctg1545:935-1936(-)
MNTYSNQQSYVVSRGQDVLKQAVPIVAKAEDILNDFEPVLHQIMQAYRSLVKALAPFHLEELFPAVYGLILCFFGGTYMMLTSALEAFKLFGFDKVKRNLQALQINFIRAQDALRKDNTVDSNHDGVVDVQQLDGRALLSRRVGIFFKSVNPEEVFTAIEGLLQGWIGVVATLKTKYARYIAIGAAIGDSLNKLLGPILTQIAQGVLPSEYYRWAPITIRYGCRVFGVSVAWTIARVINSFYSSVRGAEIFLVGLTSFLIRRRYMDQNLIVPGSLLFTGLYVLVAASGFLLQFWRQYTLPFPFNILLFPATVLEYLLTWAVAVDKEVKPIKTI